MARTRPAEQFGVAGELARQQPAHLAVRPAALGRDRHLNYQRITVADSTSVLDVPGATRQS